MHNKLIRDYIREIYSKTLEFSARDGRAEEDDIKKMISSYFIINERLKR